MLKHKRYSNLFFSRCDESIVPFQGHVIGHGVIITGQDMLFNVIHGTTKRAEIFDDAVELILLQLC